MSVLIDLIACLIGYGCLFAILLFPLYLIFGGLSTLAKSFIQRSILYGPVIFTLVGTGCGICLAMLFRHDPDGGSRLKLDSSLPFAIPGAIVGWSLGYRVMVACARWPGIVPVVGVVSVTLLGAAMTAPLGWIRGADAIDAREPYPGEGMIGGALIGASMGLVLGVTQTILDRWKRSA